MEEKSIKSIQFGLFSPEKILKMAVCEIDKTDIFDEKGLPIEGGINDLRMGSTDNSLTCKTCNKKNDKCPGHFGYIKLAQPVFHAELISECIKILKCICFHCHQLLIDDYDEYAKLLKIKNPKKRQLKVYNLCKNIKICKERKKKDDKNLNFKDIYYKPGCACKQPEFQTCDLKILFSNYENNGEYQENHVLSPLEVLDIFRSISETDCKLLGFDVKNSTPSWMIIQNLLVCPPIVRLDNDFEFPGGLTLKYTQIIQCNKELISKLKSNHDINLCENEFDELQLSVAELIESISERLKGEKGRIRNNLMGKTVDFCARSVISPDPNIKLDEIGVPLSIAMNVTFPERVNDLNINKLKKLVNNGPNKYPGANMLITPDGRKIDLRFKNNKKEEYLESGYIVERHLQDGDYVLVNKQPSLSQSCMMGHRVRILPYSTFGINISTTCPYKANFDGDEMNIHIPQSLEAKSELMNIMHVPKLIVSPRSGLPEIWIKEDALIGCKLFTERNNFLTYEQVCDLIMCIDDFDINKLPMPCILKPQPLWSGKQIFSLLLPEKLNITKLREDNFYEDDRLNLMDNFVKIKNGELIQGIICKKTIGRFAGGIIYNIWIEEGPQSVMKFIDNCQKMMNAFLLLKGWTFGISDVICDKITEKKIALSLKEMDKNINNILQDAQIGELVPFTNETIKDSFEIKVCEETNKKNIITSNILKKSLNAKNHLINMLSAGSKINPINILQTICFVGQQFIEGERIPFKFKNRTLPHFLKDDYTSKSKGFIHNSFFKGLTPQEFFFNSMSFRGSLIDESLKIKDTGYIQRCLAKSLEDIMIEYDGTVRDSLGHIIQFSYGDDGMGGEYIQEQKFETYEMKNIDLVSNYKFIENDNENESKMINNWRLFMNDDVIEELKKFDLVKLKNILNEEYEQIKNDRDYFRALKISSKINLPININYIITSAKNFYRINDNNKSDLSPLYVISKVKELKQSLIQLVEDSSLTLFHKVLNYSLSTKNVIFTHRLSKQSFDFICNEIKEKFEQALASQGEMVGALAAQSIGESIFYMPMIHNFPPSMSKRINYFSFPRLKEIIRVDKNLKYPSMKIYLKEKENHFQYGLGEVNIKEKLKYKSFSDIIELSEIYYDPDIRHSIINEDQEILDEYFEIMGDEIENDEEYISPWLLRLVLNQNFFGNFDLMDNIIKKKIIKGDIFIIKSPTIYAEEKKILIRLKADPLMEEDEKKEILSFDFLKIFENKLLNEKTPLSGIPSIKNVYERIIPKIEFDIGGELRRGNQEIVFETEGSDLKEVFKIDEVDHTRTISNDIHEIYDVLGIEAARKSIFNELKNFFSPYGIHLNLRHFSLLCDYMTQRGYLTSIDKYGFNSWNKSPIRKATFGDIVKILFEAGVFAENDELKGISENIAVGKLNKIGTGCFDLKLEINN